VLLLHRPDPLLDADEAAGALTRLVTQGKVRAVGVSNFAPHQVDLLASRLDVPVVTNQVELSVTATGALHDGSLDHAQRHRYPPMIWSALGGGDLFTSGDDRFVRIRDVLEEVGTAHGVSVGATALAWVLRHPARPVAVLGTMNPDRIADLAHATHVELERQEWFAILEASSGRAVP
jgi:predicted oxidoreductase